MHLTLKIVILLVLSSGFSVTFPSFGQDFSNDTVVQSNFKTKLTEMVDDLAMTDSVEVEFYEIYTEYGLFMKEAYENRVGWIRLNHQYQWAIRDRDSKLQAILDDQQFNCFIRHQTEIEREARRSK